MGAFYVTQFGSNSQHTNIAIYIYYIAEIMSAVRMFIFHIDVGVVFSENVDIGVIKEGRTSLV